MLTAGPGGSAHSCLNVAKQWFMADPHFGDLCNIKKRPAASADEWDDYVITHINSVVKPDHSITFLGDFSRHSAKSFLDRIDCKNVHVVLGNHDRRGCGRYFKTCNEYKEIEIQGHHCVLFHYPIAYWHWAERGAFHLHGHVHDWYPDYMGQQARALDVSCDTALRFFGAPYPFSEDFIIKWMLAREGHASVAGRDRIR